MTNEPIIPETLGQIKPGVLLKGQEGQVWEVIRPVEDGEIWHDVPINNPRQNIFFIKEKDSDGEPTLVCFDNLYEDTRFERVLPTPPLQPQP